MAASEFNGRFGYMDDTDQIPGERIIRDFNLSPERSDNNLKIYKAPLTVKARDEMNKIKICESDFGDHIPSSEKNILVLGASGSGKSTMINCLINFLTCTKYEDEHRFTLVDLEESEVRVAHNQAFSQTDWITVYKIGVVIGGCLRDKINIIDTPGFADTRGKERDEETIKQIRILFEQHIATLDAVCLTVNGTITRLTDNQKYIFQSVAGIFGKDIKRNIFVWCTWTNDDNPHALNALKQFGIKYSAHFCFENGSLYTREMDKKKRKMKSMNFEFAFDSFSDFFEALKKVNPQTLAKSKDVLEKRFALKRAKNDMADAIEQTIHQMSNIRNIERQLKEHEKDIESNKDFMIEDEEEFQDVENTKLPTRVLNCEQCKRTCCENCQHWYNMLQPIFSIAIPALLSKIHPSLAVLGSNEACKGALSSQTANMFNCSLIDFNENCQKCKCPSSRHANSNEKRYFTNRRKVQKEFAEKKQEYERANREANETRSALEIERRNYEEREQCLRELIQQLAQILTYLKEIALYPERSTILEVIEQIERKYRQDSHSQEIFDKVKRWAHQQGI